MTSNAFTPELSVDAKEGLFQIEEFTGGLIKAAGAADKAAQANKSAGQTIAEQGAQAGAAAKANAALAQSTAAVGNETEKTTPRLRVQQNELRSLEARIAAFTARHDPLSKARRDLANAEDLYTKAARRGVDLGDAQIRAIDNIRARVSALANDNLAGARSADQLTSAYTATSTAITRASLEIAAAAVKSSTNIGELTTQIAKLQAARATLAAPIQIILAQHTGLDRGPSSATTQSRGEDIAAWAAELDKLQAKFDPVFAAEKRYLAALEELFDAHRKGAVEGEAYAAALAKIDAELDPVTAAAAKEAAAIEDVLRQYDKAYAETAAYVEEVDRVTAILDKANASEAQRRTVLEAVAAAYDPAVKASRDAATAAEQEATARQKLIDTARAQQSAENAQSHYNNLLGVREPVRGTAAASASVFEDAERDAKALEDLRRKYDATYAAEARYADEVKRVTAVLDANGVAETERAAILAKVEAGHNGAAAGAKAQGQALRLLVPQLNDVFVTAMSGMNPLMIAIQQGPQIIDAFVLSGKEAGSAMLRLAATAAPIALLVGSVAALMAAQEGYNAALRETARVNKLTGGSSGFSNAGLEDQANASAKAVGISISAARDLQNAYIGTGKIGGQVMTGLVAVTKDYAAATKQDSDKASQELAGMFSDPAKAAEDAAQRWHLFSDAQVQVIKNLQAQGRLEEAQQALLSGIKERVQGASQDLAWYAKAWEKVGTAISDAWTALGKWASGDKTTGAARIAQLQQEIAAANKTPAQGALARQRQIQAQSGRQNELAKALMDAEADSWDAARKSGDAAFKDLQSQAMNFVRGMNPALVTSQDFANAQNLINTAVARGAITREQGTQALEAYRRQLEQTIDPQKTMVDAINREAEALTIAVSQRRAWANIRDLGNNPTHAGREVDFGEAATVQGANDNAATAQSGERVRLLKETTAAQKALNEAQRSQDPYRIAKATEELSIAQERANGATVTGEEQSKRLGRAADQVSTQLGIQTDNLSLATQQQWLYTMAAGDGEAMMRKARIEAEVLAASKKGLGEATRRELEAQEELVSSGIHLEFAGQIDQEAAANERLAAALGVSVGAYRDAEIYNKAVGQALKETPPEYDDAGAATGKFSEKIAANVEVLKKQQAAVDGVDLGKYVQNLQFARKDLDFRVSTAGMSEDAKAVAKAQYDTVEALRRQGKEYATLEPAARAQFDLAVKTAAENAQIEQGIKRQEDAWNQVGQVGENAFSRIGDAITTAMANGQVQAIKWGNVLKAMVASVTTDLVKLASVDLAHMVGLQQSKGGLLDLFTGSSSTQQQQAQSGGLLSNGNLVSLGSKLLPGDLTSGLTSGIDQWGMSALGIGQSATMLAGQAAVTPTASVLASQTAMLQAANPGLAVTAAPTVITGSSGGAAGGVAAGTGLSAYAASAGAGALGGTIGGLIGTATNSKLIGGLSGAALGAGSAGLASLVGLSAAGGPVGLAIGAVVGGIMGALGTNKKQIPVASAGVQYDASGTLVGSAALTDNGGSQTDADNMLSAMKNFQAAFVAGTDAVQNKLFDYSIGSKEGKITIATPSGNTPVGGEYSDINTAIIDTYKKLVSSGTFSIANTDVNTAMASARTDTADNFIADLNFAKTFRSSFDAMNAAMDPVSNTIKTLTEAAATLGSQLKTSVTDWIDQASRLGLASEADLVSAGRSAIAASMGLSDIAKPMSVVATAQAQAKINLEQYLPVLQRLGYTTAEISDVSDRYTAKLVDAASAQLELTKRSGEIAVQQAQGQKSKLSSADRLTSAGFDLSYGNIADLARGLDAIDAAAAAGISSGTAYADMLAKANAVLDDGSITQAQYGEVISAITADIEFATSVATNRRNLEIALMEASGDAAGAVAAKRQQELDALDPSLRSLQELIYARQDEAALATNRRNLEITLMEASGDAAGAMSAKRQQELEALDPSLRSLQELIYVRQDEAATATAQTNLYLRELSAQTAVGRANTLWVTSLETAAKRQTELQAATDDGTRAVLLRIYSLEDEAAALQRARTLRDSNSDLLARRQTALGDSTGAAITRFDLDAARQLEAAITAGQDISQLQAVLAAERAKTVFDQAQQVYVSAIDREISARQNSTQALQETALKIAQIAEGFGTARDALKISDKSDLSPLQRLEEVRSQFEAAVTNYQAANDNDVKATYAQQIQDLGNQRVDIANGYYATTDYSDYRRVLAVFDQFSIANDSAASTAEETIRQNNQIIAALTEQRSQAESLGQRQLGSLDSLQAVMRQAKDALDAQTAALAATPAPMVTVTIAGQTITTGGGTVSPVLTASQRYLAANADVAADTGFSSDPAWHYALYGAREGRDSYGMALTQDEQYLVRYADVAAAVAAGTYKNGREHYELYGRDEGRQYAAGGLVEGGTPGVDSVRAWLMPGERVLSVPHSMMLEQIYGMATLATGSSRPANDPLPPNVIVMPQPVAQPAAPQLEEIVKLLRELIALIGTTQAKALIQSEQIGEETVAKLQDLIEEITESVFIQKVAATKQ